jgi:prepilin-type N-terminal cleavage/methylation domain-containing protein
MKMYQSQLNNEKGFTLIEVAIVVAIIATLLAGLKIVPSILASNRANGEISQMPKITSSLQAHYFNKPNYVGLANSIVNSFEIVPDSMNQGGSTISNRWAGTLTFAPTTTTTANDSFSMVYTQVPSNECKKIVMGVAENFLKVSVGSTVVKAVGGSVDDATLATACDSASQNSITYVGSK